jgi:hypothetical protein
VPGIFWGVKGGWHRRLTTSLPSVHQLFRKFGTLDIPQSCEPPWPVTGMALPLFVIIWGLKLKNYIKFIL